MQRLALVSTLLLITSAFADVQQVAIVGGGIGGASSAYFLSSLTGKQVNLTIFERSDDLGGRTSSWEGAGEVIELGASIAWTGNQYLRYLAGEAGLSLRDKGASSGAQGDQDLLAVFDGTSLVFRQSRWGLLTLLRMLWRYGLSYFQLRGHPLRMSTRFAGVYELQKEGKAFERPEQLLKSLGLYDLTQQNMVEYMRNEFGSSMDLFASEVVAGVGRVNYNQANLQLNALAGLVSLLPAVDPSVFSIQGGNQQLAPRVAAAAGAAVVRSQAVGQVTKTADGRFKLGLEGSRGEGRGCKRREGAGGEMTECSCGSGAVGMDAGSTLAGRRQRQAEGGGVKESAWRGGDQVVMSAVRGQGGSAISRGEEEGGQQEAAAATLGRRGADCCHPTGQQGLGSGAPGGGKAGAGSAAPSTVLASGHGPFDAVIIATPLEGSGLSFRGVDLPRIPPRTYQSTVTTLVEGQLRPQYFRLQDSMPFTDVMVTEDAATPFSSVSLVGRTAGKRGGDGGTAVYKLFSQRLLEEEELDAIFEQGYAVLVSKAWKAYPRFDPPEDFAPFKLADGLFYSNALESAASAMEMAAVGGRNSALLAADYLLQRASGAI